MRVFRTSDYCIGTSREIQRTVEDSAKLISIVLCDQRLIVARFPGPTISLSPSLLGAPEKSCLGIPVLWESISWMVTLRPMSSSSKAHSGIRSRILVDHRIVCPRCCANVSLDIRSPTERERKSLLLDAIPKIVSGVMGVPSSLAIPCESNSIFQPFSWLESRRTTATDIPVEFHRLINPLTYVFVESLISVCCDSSVSMKGF